LLGTIESVWKVSVEAISIPGRKSVAGDKRKICGVKNKMLTSGTVQEDKVHRF